MAAEPPLAGAVAIVTGASGKLGPVWIEALRAAGATVAGIDLRAADGVWAADVTDRDGVAGAVAAIEAELGAPRVLVNNAGIDVSPEGEGGEERLEDFQRTIDVNLAGVFNVTQVVGPRMAAAGGGAIVNIGSLYASIAPVPDFYDHLPGFVKPAAYGASKAGVVQMTKYFARRWGPRNIRVNALSPGGLFAGQDERFLAKYCGRVPLGRMAEPADLTGPLVFLASDASRYLTGHELRVDGGFTA
jgi:NAD(P)-dependent dehydrogenase (short-subunit alcohol dehydrogenase family)